MFCFRLPFYARAMRHYRVAALFAYHVVLCSGCIFWQIGFFGMGLMPPWVQRPYIGTENMTERYPSQSSAPAILVRFQATVYYQYYLHNIIALSSAVHKEGVMLRSDCVS